MRPVLVKTENEVYMELDVGDKVLYGRNTFAIVTIARVTNTMAVLSDGTRIKRNFPTAISCLGINNATEVPLVGEDLGYKRVIAFLESSLPEVEAFMERQNNKQRDKNLINSTKNIFEFLSSNKELSPSQRKALEDVIASFK